MFNSTIQTLEQFKGLLLQLPEDCYNKPCSPLSEATIGKHTRHIIEVYLCLLEGYEKGEVSYDKRKRDRHLENRVVYAIEKLQYIQSEIERPNKNLKVIYELDREDVPLVSNYRREVMYNLEHTIHHEALIKVAICHFTDLQIPTTFGVAPSTIKYWDQCAQ